jgi:hypothetical protein
VARPDVHAEPVRPPRGHAPPCGGALRFRRALARCLVLGTLLAEVQERFGGYDLVAHWTQGEFHHDVVLRLPEAAASALPGRVLVVATNCNGGIKDPCELLAADARSELRPEYRKRQEGGGWEQATSSGTCRRST